MTWYKVTWNITIYVTMLPPILPIPPPPSSHPATLLQLSDMSFFLVKVMSESVWTCKLTSVSVWMLYVLKNMAYVPTIVVFIGTSASITQQPLKILWNIIDKNRIYKLFLISDLIRETRTDVVVVFCYICLIQCDTNVKKRLILKSENMKYVYRLWNRLTWFNENMIETKRRMHYVDFCLLLNMSYIMRWKCKKKWILKS